MDKPANFSELVHQHGIDVPRDQRRAPARRPANSRPASRRPQASPPEYRTLRRAGMSDDGAESYFCRDFLSRGDWSRLRQGQIKPEQSLDLHGATIDDAKILLKDFLESAHQRGCRCVRLIHGKGLRRPNQGATIKSSLRVWLPKSDAVLAFCPLPDADGRSGAMDVLLKKS